MHSRVFCGTKCLSFAICQYDYLQWSIKKSQPITNRLSRLQQTTMRSSKRKITKNHLRESSAVSPSSSLFSKSWHSYLYCSLRILLWKLEYRHPKEPGVIVAQKILPLFLVLVHPYHLSFQRVSQICPSVRKSLRSASSQTCVRVCCEAS